MARPLILAHRGDWTESAECSLPALAAALRRPGVNGVEFDVRAALDGTPVVIHDATLRRSHGIRRRVSDLSVDELRRLGVPSLREVLEALPAPFFLDIELKEDVGRAAMPIIAAARGDPPRDVAVSSFGVGTVAAIKAVAPRWRCWLLARRLDDAVVATAQGAGCDGIAARWPTLTPAGIRRVAAGRLELVTWTVRDRETLTRMRSLPLVAICVDPPALP